MKILRLRAYYQPEKTAGIHLDMDLSEAFANNRIIYESYSPQPTRGVSDEDYKNYIKDELLFNSYTIVHRFPMMREKNKPLQRAFRYLLCSIMEYRLGINTDDVDIVYSSSTPPTQGFLSAKVAKKLSKKYKSRIPFVYNLQDVFPDSLVNTGMTKKGSLIWKIGRRIEDYTYRNADKIIVISDSFKDNLIKKGVPKEKIVVISNWVNVDEVKPIERDSNRLFDDYGVDRSKFVAVYAGNLGEAQGAEVIIDAAKLLLPFSDIQFVIFGGGAKFEDIKNRVKTESIRNVIVTNLMSRDRISEVYSMGDVALITCKPGTGSAGFPSKTWSIMACNTPVIAAFDTDSDLAKVIKLSGTGTCIEPDNPHDLAEAILGFKKANVNVTRVSPRQYVIDNASKDVCTSKYIDVFKMVRT